MVLDDWLFRNHDFSSEDDALLDDFLFGIDHIRRCANAWLDQTYLSRRDPTNWKQMLLVHGPVKSSKMTIIQPGGKLEYVQFTLCGGHSTMSSEKIQVLTFPSWKSLLKAVGLVRFSSPFVPLDVRSVELTSITSSFLISQKMKLGT